MSGIFYEPQRGGLCRLHALNAFFGEPRISEEEFRKYSGEMDEYIKQKYHGESQTLDFDSVSSDHNILVTFILKKFGFYVRYLHINAVYGKMGSLKDNLGDLVGDFFFVFNADHIWGMRRARPSHAVQDFLWYKVDSLSGVTRLEIGSLEGALNIGFIIPVDQKVEFYKNVSRVRDVVALSGAVEYITDINSRRLILGDLEVPIGIAMDILDTKLEFDWRGRKREPDESQEYAPIRRLVGQYNEFLKEFVPARYHDLELKLKYVAHIVGVLLKLTPLTKKN